MTQLADYLRAHGQSITVRTRTFVVEGPDGDGDIHVATFRAPRASYHGVLCINARVPGAPTAEVWSVIGGRRTVCTFAVHAGSIVPLS